MEKELSAVEQVEQIEFYVGTILGMKFIKKDSVFKECLEQDYKTFEEKCKKNQTSLNNQE